MKAQSSPTLVIFGIASRMVRTSRGAWVTSVWMHASHASDGVRIARAACIASSCGRSSL